MLAATPASDAKGSVIQAPFQLPARVLAIARGLVPIALVAAFVSACSSGLSLSRDPERPNVVLVTLDTTRPDHLGCYGYARDTSPNVDQLCREALVFRNAYSTTSWTLPAHASLFTGTLPISHGADYDDEGPLLLSEVLDARSSEGHRVHGLDAGARTLAQLAGERGYATAGFVGGPWMKALFGLDLGFELWDDEGISALNGRRAAELSEAALLWLDGVGAERPFFLFLNYYDPHSPYEPPTEWRDAFLPMGAPPPGAAQNLEQAVALYDAEILYTDHHLGRIFEALRAAGAWDASWVIVTADHGDLLGEHGIAGHGRFLYEGEIRVPLIVKPPAGAQVPMAFGGGESAPDAPVQLTDVLPMLADSLAFEVPVAAERTRALLAQDGRRWVVSELDPGPRHRGRGSWKSLIDGPHKFVWNSRGKHRLFDLSHRAGEKLNRVGEDAPRSQRMDGELEALLAELPRPERRGDGGARVVDEETRRALEGLGYLDPSPRDEQNGSTDGLRGAPGGE